jgi:hypothetical protein
MATYTATFTRTASGTTPATVSLTSSLSELPSGVTASSSSFSIPISAIQLGRDAPAPPFCEGIISATYTEECEAVDVSNRSNVGGTGGAPGRRVSRAGYVTKTWEIECHDPDGLTASLNAAGSGFSIMSVSENIGIDGAVTFNVTVKEL